MTNRYYAVGDIHGCIHHLNTAIDYITNENPDGCKVIFLGDYIDRGPDSIGCLEKVRDFQEDDNGFDVVTLCGNHEQMFIEAYHGRFTYYDEEASWQIRQGGEQFWAEWMMDLPTYHIVDNNIFAHAAWDHRLSLTDQNDMYLMWHRYLWTEPFRLEGYHLTHGHTPVKHGPEQAPGRTDIDTGAVFGGPLTVAEYHANKLGPQRFISITNDTFVVDSQSIKEYKD